MDFKALKNNIADSLDTTNNVYNATKKLFWIYNLTSRKSGNKKVAINFNYPQPVGNIRLNVRYNQGSDSFIISEVFKDQCYFISQNNEINTILDLGANAGFTSVYFSKFFPKAQIACVEPMPNNISILKESLTLNNVNAIIFEAAVSVADQEITMQTGDRDYGNKVHDIPFGKEMNNNTLIVNGLSIETIIRQLNWEQIDLLKIDIEGYEGILLKENNNWLSKVNMIIMEIHEGVTIEFIKKITTPYGFIHAKLQKGNWVLSKKAIF